MADESVWTPLDAAELVRQQAADVASIYVSEAVAFSRRGGASPLSIQRVFPALSARCRSWGSVPRRQSPAIAAPDLSFACDACGALYHTDDLITDPLRFEDGFAYPPETPGLGIDIDRDALELPRGLDRRDIEQGQILHPRLRRRHARASTGRRAGAIQRKAFWLLDAAGESLAGSALAHPALKGSRLLAAPSARSAPDVAMLLTARAVAGLRDALHVETTMHAPAVIFGTLAALARTRAVPGRAFLEAYIAGVEAACRLADALDPVAIYGRNFHPTAICGALGAAVSAARLLGLDADRLEAAIGLAMQMAAGHTVWMHDQSDSSRPLSAAGAARTGTMAALLAAHGVGGRTAALDGAESLFQTYSAAPRRERLLHDWRKRYYAAELTYKPTPPAPYARGHRWPARTARAREWHQPGSGGVDLR